MTRTMYDGVTPSSIPASATMVAGYVDGTYANIPAMRKRFPAATLVEIAVSWQTRAHVLDVEKGDATPAEAVKWCTHTMADRANGELTVYCNNSVWTQVKAAFKAASVTPPQFWIAHWDDNPTIPAGAVAKQYRNTPGYDVSSVATHWPGVDTKSPPTPYEPFPGAAWFTLGRKSPIVAAMHARLVAEGCNHYHSTSNKDVIGTGDIASYEAWQRKLGYTGTAAKWPPGKTSWDKLHVPNV